MNAFGIIDFFVVVIVVVVFFSGCKKNSELFSKWSTIIIWDRTFHGEYSIQHMPLPNCSFVLLRSLKDSTVSVPPPDLAWVSAWQNETFERIELKPKNSYSFWFSAHRNTNNPAAVDISAPIVSGLLYL